MRKAHSKWAISSMKLSRNFIEERGELFALAVGLAKFYVKKQISYSIILI